MILLGRTGEAFGFSSPPQRDETERNIVRVRPGSQASVAFDAIPDLELLGNVSGIRTLGENEQGDITYTVTITLDQQDPRLRWNITATG